MLGTFAGEHAGPAAASKYVGGIEARKTELEAYPEAR